MLRTLEGGTAARSKRYSSTGRAEREKNSHQSGHGASELEGCGGSKSTSIEQHRRELYLELPWVLLPQAWAPVPALGILLWGDTTMASPPSLGELVPSPWCPNLPP